MGSSPIIDRITGQYFRLKIGLNFATSEQSFSNICSKDVFEMYFSWNMKQLKNLDVFYLLNRNTHSRFQAKYHINISKGNSFVFLEEFSTTRWLTEQKNI